MCSWWHGLVRGACHSDLTGPLLFLVSAQPYVFPCLNIKAAFSVDLCASIQDMLFCPKISSEPVWSKTRTQLCSGSYPPAVFQARTCRGSTPSRILNVRNPIKWLPCTLCKEAMPWISHHFYYHLVVLGLLWLCVMLHYV